MTDARIDISGFALEFVCSPSSAIATHFAAHLGSVEVSDDQGTMRPDETGMLGSFNDGHALAARLIKVGREVGRERTMSVRT